MERKPLGELEGEASHANADVSNSDSFSVYEDPSQASIHVDLSTSRLHIRPVHYHLVPDASKPHRDQPLPHSYTNPGSTDQHALHSCTLSGSAAARVTTANTHTHTHTHTHTQQWKPHPRQLHVGVATRN